MLYRQAPELPPVPGTGEKQQQHRPQQMQLQQNIPPHNQMRSGEAREEMQNSEAGTDSVAPEDKEVSATA